MATSTYIRSRQGIPTTSADAILPRDGLPAWLEFAGAVRAGDPRYARGTRLTPFLEQLFTEVVRSKRGSAGGPLQAAALTQVETAMAAWFAAVAVPQTHVIPCAIIPEAAAPFTVGPVRLSHASAFNAQTFGISPGLEDVSLGPMNRAMIGKSRQLDRDCRRCGLRARTFK